MQTNQVEEAIGNVKTLMVWSAAMQTGRIKVATAHFVQMLETLEFYAQGGNDGGVKAKALMSLTAEIEA